MQTIISPDSFELGGWSNYIGKRFELHYSDGQVLTGLVKEDGARSDQGLVTKFVDFQNGTLPYREKIVIIDGEDNEQK